jgi:hypothetical protein
VGANGRTVGLRRLMVGAISSAVLASAVWTGGGGADARTVGLGPPSSWIVNEVVYCNQSNAGCSDTVTGRPFSRPPTGYNRRLHCRWATTGFSTGLLVYKYFCVVLHGAVLGSSDYAPNGEGWGTQHPVSIFNGGDPSGLVTNINWRRWGSGTAYGRGRNAIFKPGGGYFPQLVWIRLRADHIGRCTRGGPRAYRRLSVRLPSRPGGPLGPWIPWVVDGRIC